MFESTRKMTLRALAPGLLLAGTCAHAAALPGDLISTEATFAAPGAASQLVASDRYNLLFLRNSGSAIRIVDTTTMQEIDVHLSNQSFRDIDLSPSGRYLYAADWGRVRIGYGTLINPHYVHRYDLQTRTWEQREVTVDVGRIEAIDDDRYVTLESDQWVDVHLQRWEADGSVSYLDSNGADYYGDIEYDPKYNRIYHGNSGSSSREIDVIRLNNDDLIAAGGTGTYGSAQSGGGTSVLSTDGEHFYYGNLQVEALDVTNNINTFPERIYAATGDIAVGQNSFFNPDDASKIDDFGYSSQVSVISSDEKFLWR